jgi:hypothetical protein
MFIVEKNNEIILADENREQLETTLKFMPDCVDCEIVETPRPIAEIDGKFVYADTAEYKEAKNAEIAKVRGNLYTETIDPLHAQKQRKTVLGKWTEADEAEYVAEVKRLTQKIQEENPYIE